MFYELLESAFEQIEIGGWVMWPLIIACLWIWYLAGKKIVDMNTFARGFRPLLEFLDEIGKKDYSAALWQKEIISRYLTERTDNKDMNESIIESLRIHQEEFVTRYVSTISLLATIAPLLGLLGTVGGMIKTFSVIAEFGTGNARALAGGISEALITTQTGLVVAVPGLFLASFLTRRTDDLLERIHRFCLGLGRAKLDTNYDLK